MNKEVDVRLVKAATMGYAQSLLNRGYSPDAVLASMEAYTNPYNGLLQKRANDRAEFVKQQVYRAIKGI